jgi:hypothetical protein
MKTTLLTALCAIALQASAQPVILNGDKIPAPGMSVAISTGSAAGGTGSAGASQTWDFSAVSFTQIGNFSTVNPSSTPHTTSFPSATHAYTFSNTYSYFNASSTKMEVLGYTIVSPGSGNDYTPNPRTVLKFPFNFGNSLTDDWQKAGGSTNSVTITYDAYGTLIMPTKTYQNVVRVKEDYGSGGVDYQWYILNPLMSVLVFDHNTSTFYYVGATATAINAPAASLYKAELYPTPASDKLTLTLNAAPLQNELTLSIMNMSGQIIRELVINSQVTDISIDDMPSGIYVYQLKDEQNTVKTGKIIVE